MTALPAVLDKHLPPLSKRTHPGLAAVIGVLTGGIGLAIYFRSVRDLFPVEVAGALTILGSLATGSDPLLLASVVAPVVGGLYGFWRAQSSNRRLGASIVPDDLVGSVG